MPTYEYRCKDCGREIEVVQSFTDDPLTECEECGGALRKVFGNIGITFKGSGFYRNDSRQAGPKRSSTAAGSGSKEAKSDSSATSADSGSASTAGNAGSNGNGDGGSSSKSDSGSKKSDSGSGSGSDKKNTSTSSAKSA